MLTGAEVERLLLLAIMLLLNVCILKCAASGAIVRPYGNCRRLQRGRQNGSRISRNGASHQKGGEPWNRAQCRW